MSKPRIEPRLLKGFRDTNPSLAIQRLKMIRKLEGVFSSFGFAPIDTPALEYTEILLGKGSDETDKQLFRFTDNGGRDVALRFDLTVPLARYVAMNVGELGLPFRRYHIAPVWRAEKPQRGRYREFIQCDFDIIGPQSALADAEIISVIHTGMYALGLKTQIRLNNRRFLSALVESIGAQGKQVPILRAVDKLDKIGRDGVTEELSRTAELTPQQILKVFEFAEMSAQHSGRSGVLAALRVFFAEFENNLAHVEEMQRFSDLLDSYGIGDAECIIDLSIARGLDYYTGMVFETKLLDMPAIGSICSGGRYDDLAGLYTNRSLPGVGGSFGMDRILAALEETDAIDKASSPAKLLITSLDECCSNACAAIATNLRRAGIACELFPELGKLGGQIKYADRKGIPLVLIAGAREIENGAVLIKELKSGVQHEGVTLEQIVLQVERLLGAA